MPDLDANDPRLKALQRTAQQGSWGQVLRGTARLLEEHPDDPGALRLLGLALHRLRRLPEAADALRRRLERLGADAAAAGELAAVLLDMGDPRAALDVLVRTGAGASDDPGALFSLARAYKAFGRTGEAVAPLERVLQRVPQHVGARIMLGDACKALGRVQDADEQYRAAIAAGPGLGGPWWALANLKTRPFDSADIEQMRAGLRKAAPGERVYFEFALAQALADQGDHDAAFDHLQRGNRLRREAQPWDRERYRAWLDRISTAQQAIELPPRPAELSAPRPVFIVSLPRSGSTLTEQVLAAHPAVTAASELPWVPRLVAGESRRRGAGIAEWAGAAGEADWQRLGEAYMRHTQWWHQGEVFTDKLPGNHAYIGAILAMLPDALVISLHREARDVCFSCYRQLFVRGLEFSYDLEDLAAYWQDFEQVTTSWEQRAPERVLRVHYERLVDDLETEARRIVGFIGLDWDPACLRFFEAERAVNTASAAQVREGVSRRGLGHWKRYEAHLGPLLAALENEPGT